LILWSSIERYSRFIIWDKEAFRLKKKVFFTREVLLEWKHWNLMLKLLQDFRFLFLQLFNEIFISRIYIIEGLEKKVLMILAHSWDYVDKKNREINVRKCVDMISFHKFLLTMHRTHWNEVSLLTFILIHILCSRAPFHSIQFLLVVLKTFFSSPT